LFRGQGETEARALTFTTLVIANLGLMLTNRSWSSSLAEILRVPNTALWLVMSGAVLFLVVILNFSVFRGVFRFAPLHPNDIVLCILAGGLSIFWFEVFKLRNNNRGRKRDRSFGLGA
jgi:Ca2+-transporting ATPase